MDSHHSLSGSSLFEAFGYGPIWVRRNPLTVVDQTPAQIATSPSVSVSASLSEPSSEPLPMKHSAKSSPKQMMEEPSKTQPAVNTITRPSNNQIAHFDWETLKTHTLACQACGLCETRTQVVFGVGNPKCSLMLIGEAPGEQEDLTGEPFVGKSGQLLDQMLKAIGLDRNVDNGVFIANTLKCRPPENRNPQPEELKACEPLLQQQIRTIRPKVLLAVGRFAVQWLMGVDELEGSISSLRGKSHIYKDGNLEIPFVVTYHPSYLLRNPSAKALAWDDLCLLKTMIV